MSLKTILVSLAKYLLLAAIYFATDMTIGMLLPTGLDWTPPADQVTWIFGGMLLTALVNTLVISLIVARSSGSAVQVGAATAFAWYGTMTFLAQIEAYWFAPSLGLPRSVPFALARNAVPLVALVTLAAMLLWVWRRPPQAQPNLEERLPHTPAEWLWKLAAIAIVYVALYYSFGYIVAWQNPALRDMYANGADSTVFNSLYLTALQIGRSALWVLFALPVIRMVRGPLWQVALLVALLYALPMNIGHILPSPIMPDPSVRLSHFIETATSNFIFGLAVTWLLSWRPGHVAVKSAAPARP